MATMGSAAAVAAVAGGTNTTTSINTNTSTRSTHYYKQVAISMLQDLQTYNLTLSVKQQDKLLSRGHLLSQVFSKDKLYVANTIQYAAVLLTDNFTYVHVWKSGGTTVQWQKKALEPNKNPQVSLKVVEEKRGLPPVPLPTTTTTTTTTTIQNEQNNNNYYNDTTKKKKVEENYYFTFVRDPLQHFLSGWAECGYRAIKAASTRSSLLKRQCKNEQQYKRLGLYSQEYCVLLEGKNRLDNLSLLRSTTTTNASSAEEEQHLRQQRRQDITNRMVMEWLELTKSATRQPFKKRGDSCSTHSFPQGNFLLKQPILPPSSSKPPPPKPSPPSRVVVGRGGSQPSSRVVGRGSQPSSRVVIGRGGGQPSSRVVGRGSQPSSSVVWRASQPSSSRRVGGRNLQQQEPPPPPQVVVATENGNQSSSLLLMEKLVLVADLREVEDVITNVVKFPFNPKIGKGRDRSTEPEKKQYFPARLDWLSNETILALCDFVAIDYFLLDYDPPEVCREMLAKYDI